MTKRNKNLLILSVLVVMTAILVSLVIRRQNQPVNRQETNGQPVHSPESGDRIFISTSTGKLKVKDFRKNAEIDPNNVIYFVDKDNYNIAYNSTDNEFILTLLVDKEIEKSRKEMELDFLTALDVSESDACKLKTYVYVSAAVASDLSDNHGLSFCAGSKPFPN